MLSLKLNIIDHDHKLILFLLWFLLFFRCVAVALEVSVEVSVDQHPTQVSFGLNMIDKFRWLINF